MSLRNYIEKTAATKRQLRLAKKYMDELVEAKNLRRAIARKQHPPLPPKGKLELRKSLNLGRIASAVDSKHQYGREAARFYAMGNSRMGDMMRDLGKQHELKRQRHMTGIPKHKFGNLQSKARKAFGKANK